ncbi:MAG: hypothetical protein ACM3YE_03060 [Bacteroidota bacterium]
MKRRPLMVFFSIDFKTKQTFARYFYLTLALLFLSLPAASISAAIPEGAPPDGSIKARLELKEAGPFYVGDSIPINLIVEGVSGVEYSLPEFGSKELGGLELAAKDQVKQEEVKDGWKHTVPYRLVGWRAGDYQISGLTINYQDRNGNQGSVALKELSIKITSLLPANLTEEEILADGLKSPKKPVGFPPRYQYLWVLCGGLVLLGLIYWLLKYLKDNYRSKVAAGMEQDAVKLEPAHHIALRRLEGLKQEHLLEAGEYKLFYDRLSEIAREYMENRFQFKALEMTTEEFLINLGNKDFLNLAQKKAVAEFLQYSDLVKFAKHQPLKEDGERALGIIYSLIEETKEEIENET